MKAWTLAVLLLAGPAQGDRAAAGAGLASPDPSLRARAACELRQLGSGAGPALPRLVAMLDDGSPVDPAVCAERTWRHGWSDDATSPGEQAASALVAIGTPAYEPLAKTLAAPAWIARKNAAWALGALGNRAAIPLLARSLHDTEAAVRGRGAWALGALDSSEAVPALVDALKDSDPGVREQVAWALGAIGDRRGVDGLIGVLADSAAGVRKQAAWALGAIGDKRAVAGLMKCLKDPEAGVRKQAAWALGAIGG
ncbi:MAG: HEAT repeat domain-containing protein [Vicinamibacterales bacterium]